MVMRKSERCESSTSDRFSLLGSLRIGWVVQLSVKVGDEIPRTIWIEVYSPTV